MCGRFALYQDSESLQDEFALSYAPEVLANYNITPQRMILTIVMDQEEPIPVYLRWGFIPHWSAKSKTDYRMINARIEGAWERQAFKSAMRYRRCLVPASGFYEWKKYNSEKIPHYITVQNSNIFAMAGIWDSWRDNNSGEIIESCAILTTAAQGTAAWIHERMPVIIQPSGYAPWLNPAIQTRKELEIITAPENALTAWPVSRLVNNPRNNSPELIIPHEQ